MAIGARSFRKAVREVRRAGSVCLVPGLVLVAACPSALVQASSTPHGAATQTATQPPAEAPSAVKPVPAVAVPSAGEIVSKYVAALGGEEALRKVTSRTETGTVEMLGNTAEYKLIGAAPDHRIVVVKSEKLGEQVQGYNGTVGWDIANGGSRVLSGPELAYRAYTCDFYRPLNLGSKFELRVMGIEDRNGKPCHKIGATPIAAAPKDSDGEGAKTEPKPEAEKPRETVLFFDTESGLLVGQIVLRPTATGDLGVDTSYSEFKKFDGVLVPTRTVSKVMTSVQTVTVVSVEFNTVPANSFEIPASVKEVLAKPAAAPSNPPTKAPVQAPPKTPAPAGSPLAPPGKK